MKRIFITLFVFIICSHLIKAQSSKLNNELTPTLALDGVIKSKYEYATETNTSRFSLRNSRIALAGHLTPIVNYRAQLELSNSGKFSVLDLYGAVNLFDGWVVKLGQSSVPLHNSYITNPGKMIFANRAFIGKFFTPSTRDIGVLTSYDTKIQNLPIGIDVGIYNGNDINNPVWTKTPSYSTRVRIGDMRGLRATAKMYKYPHNEEINFFFYGFDIRYEVENWKIETEWMHRRNTPDRSKLSSAYLQGAYWIPIKNEMIFKNMIVATRWEGMRSDIAANTVDANRITWGLGFSFTNAPFDSLLRIDYEHYFKDEGTALFNLNEEIGSNKLTLELLITF